MCDFMFTPPKETRDTFIYTAAISQICRPQAYNFEGNAYAKKKKDTPAVEEGGEEEEHDNGHHPNPKVPVHRFGDTTPVSYLYLNGPWRNCYVRFGYDPKLNPEAVKFQRPPGNRSQIYQLCDIEDSAIQGVVENEVEINRLGKTLDPTSGWMAKSTMSSIRTQLKVRSEAMRRLETPVAMAIEYIVDPRRIFHRCILHLLICLYIPGAYFADSILAAYKTQILEYLRIDHEHFALLFSLPSLTGVLCGPFGVIVA
ncbi:hypothetical protein Pmar_PMAR010838, partial [Perkinsus marinus ATCC 50983]